MPRITRRRAIGAGVTGIAAVGGYLTVARGGSTADDPAAVGAGAMDDTLAPPTLGDGAVGVAVFTDLACPACGAFSQRITPQLRSAHVATGHITYVHRDFPLDVHKWARPVANAARAIQDEAGSAAFWSFIEAAFAEAAFDRDSPYSYDLIERLGDRIADAGAVARTAAADRAYAERIDADKTLGERLGVQ
ncbi:MAG: DsbA family protein [Salinarchaeum sp.]